MSGSSAFFILIPAMYVLFTLALATIAIVDRRLIAARWAALGFSVACVSIIVDGFRDPSGDEWSAWFTVATHFIPLLIMVQAFLSRHNRNAPRLIVILTGVMCIAILPNMPWAPPYWARSIIVQVVCTVIIASGLPQLWSLRKRTRLDLVVFLVILGAAISYAGRAIVVTLNPVGSTQADLVAFYQGLNIIFHSASALMAMIVGITLVMTIGYDMLRLRVEEGETDTLTGLGNRRKMDRKIGDVETGRSAVGAVVLIDLDHFKRINDTFGHDAGDEVLRAVGRRLLKLYDGIGTVCRTGGEEFVALLYSSQLDAASSIAIATRKAIAQLEFEGALSSVNLTASIGFHRIEGDVNVREAIQLADRAVYYAKTDGRDRVVNAVRQDGLDILKSVA